MILVDTSIWIDHLHRPEPGLVSLLTNGDAWVHPMVIGELALGSMRNRAGVLGLLAALPRVPVASDDELLSFVQQHVLFGRGLSLVDAHLLAGLRLANAVLLWTRDRRLSAAAQDLGLATSSHT